MYLDADSTLIMFQFSPPVPQVGLGEAPKCVTGDLVPVGGRYKRIVPMLEHARRETWCEGLCGCVEVSQHDIALPPPHNPDCVRVKSRYQEIHVSSILHGFCTNVFRIIKNCVQAIYTAFLGDLDILVLLIADNLFLWYTSVVN